MSNSPELSDEMYLLWKRPCDKAGKPVKADKPYGTRDCTKEGIWSLEALYLSQIALLIHVIPDSSLEEQDKELTDRNKEDLRKLVRDLHLRVRQFGYHAPCVLMLSDTRECDARDYFPTKLEKLRSLSSAQEWHQGDFLVFVESSNNVKGRIQELLMPGVLPIGDSKSISDDEPQDEESMWSALESIPGASHHIQRFNGLALRQSAQQQTNREDAKHNSLPELARIKSIRPQNFRAFGEKLQSPDKRPVLDTDKRPVLDTDAEIVLLIGSNGTGKSSLLEGLSLTLNGMLPHRELRDLHHLEQGDSSSEAQAAQPAPSFELVAKVELFDETPAGEAKVQSSSANGEAEVRLTHSLEQPLRLMLEEQPCKHRTVLHGLRQEQALHQEGLGLNARVSAWFQESLAHLLDETTSGLTLLEVLSPQPAIFKNFDDWIESELRKKDEDLESQQRDVYSADQVERIEQHFQSWLSQLNAHLETLIEALEEHPQERLGQIEATTEPRAAFKSWLSISFFEKVEVRISPERLERLLNDKFGKAKRFILSRHRTTSLSHEEREEYERLQSEQKARDHALMLARECLRQLTGARESLAPDKDSLFHVLSSLSAHLEDWKRLLQQQSFLSLNDTRRELAEVQPEALIKLVREVAGFVEEQRNIIEKYETENRRFKELEERLEREQLPGDLKAQLEALEERRLTLPGLMRAEQSGDESPTTPLETAQKLWEWSDEKSERERYRKRLEEESSTLKLLQEKRNEQKNPPIKAWLIKLLKKVTNELMDRFSFELGPRPADNSAVKLALPNLGEARQQVHMTLHDGRDHTHWSAGQKAQLATLYMVAQNQVLAQLGRLPHRVLILDDVSTAYDLSNITREALIWRQLAFHQDKEQRRQIFLSSHHEELSHHLLDLLIPPHTEDGSPFKVKVIKFLQWTSKNGPAYETYSLEADQASVKNTASLKKALKEHLSP